MGSMGVYRNWSSGKDFVNCEHIIKALFFAFLLNNAHISLVFGHVATSFVGVDALEIFF